MHKFKFIRNCSFKNCYTDFNTHNMLKSYKKNNTIMQSYKVFPNLCYFNLKIR